MDASKPIRVMVVDDHDMVRRGLAAFLKTKPDLELVGEAGNGREALEKCATLQPDVILMDLMMPEMSGAAATRAILAQWPQIKVIALTSFQKKEQVHEALQAGAISYLLKNVSVDDLAEAIRAACCGRSMLASEATRALIQAADGGTSTSHDLTSREYEVLTLMVKGLTNPEIAERLSVSRSTARAHVSNVLAKLGVSNRAGAVALALRDKLVS